MLLKLSIKLLESSIMLIENIYSRLTYDRQNIFIVQTIGQTSLED